MTLQQVEPNSIYIGSNAVSKVYVGSTQVRPAAQPGWQPGPNTIAYYPLNSNTTNTDQSGNGYDLTANGTLTYTGVGGVSAINTSAGYLSGTITTIPVGAAARTLSIWEYLNSNSTAAPDFKVMWYYGNRGVQCGEQMLAFNTNMAVGAIYLANYYYDLADWDKQHLCDLYKWYHILYTYDGTTQTIYLNGTPILSQQQTINTNSNAFQIGDSVQGTNFPGYLSEMIIEDRAWSAQEVSDYYDLTKGNYGL